MKFYWTLPALLLLSGEGFAKSPNFPENVLSNQPPNCSLLCPPSLEISTNSELCVASGFDLGLPTLLGDCAGYTFVNNAPTTLTLGPHNITWSLFAPGGGSVASCVQVVTVVDSEAPNISCPPDVTASNCGIQPANLFGNATATDNCGEVSLSRDPAGPYDCGTTVVTWTAADGHGNAATCEQNVFVSCCHILFTTTKVRPTCDGACNGSITVLPTGCEPPYTFAWSNGATGDTNANICEGLYGMTITDANGCTLAANINISAFGPFPLAVIPSPGQVCPCGGSTIIATPGYTYNWSIGGPGPNTLQVTPTVSTQYTVTVTNGVCGSKIRRTRVSIGQCQRPFPQLPTVSGGNVTLHWVATCPANAFVVRWFCVKGQWNYSPVLPGSATSYTMPMPSCSSRKWQVKAQCCTGGWSNYTLETGFFGGGANEGLAEQTDDSEDEFFEESLDETSQRAGDFEAEAPQVFLSPNPSGGEILLSAERSILRVLVRDFSGSMVREILPETASTDWQLDLSEQPRGLFLLEISVEGGRRSVLRKLVLD